MFGMFKQQYYMTDELIDDFIGGGHNVTHSVFVTTHAFFADQAEPPWMAPLGEVQFVQGVAVSEARLNPVRVLLVCCLALPLKARKARAHFCSISRHTGTVCIGQVWQVESRRRHHWHRRSAQVWRRGRAAARRLQGCEPKLSRHSLQRCARPVDGKGRQFPSDARHVLGESFGGLSVRLRAIKASNAAAAAAQPQCSILLLPLLPGPKIP